ncbi:MAG: flagellar basal body rod protein FlgC [Proteobacteria bacterium]|nr:flagellar basal body rod protein FlgC [Pseudomonadota bacterium]MBU4471496.1 flagellar basal body rod protein FlgC [Pseudomonadota bacterium]MCG2752502.1 flagellar basal body rod protein FlgC [Desulfobacteraceae bacterium]
MNFFDAMQTSSSGLTAQRIRMNLISSNLANANTTKTASGGPYKRKEPVFAAVPHEKGFNGVLQDTMDRSLSQVKVLNIVEDKRKPLTKYEPDSPEANAQGYIEIPNINVIEEMVNLMMASRSYEANVTAINATKKMAVKALEIGK